MTYLLDFVHETLSFNLLETDEKLFICKLYIQIYYTRSEND